MKKYIALFAGLAFAGLVSAQSNVSKPMSFHIEKEVIPPRLTIVGTPKFVDQDQNDVIDANEKCYIRFEIFFLNFWYHKYIIYTVLILNRFSFFILYKPL